jgi:hypothetical protein
MGPFRESKQERQQSAEDLAHRSARRQYDMDEVEVRETIDKIQSGQSHFIQRFAGLRIHRVAYEHGLLYTYCAYDKSLKRIAFFLPPTVGEYMNEHRKSKKERREERKAATKVPTVSADPKATAYEKEKAALDNQIAFVNRQIDGYIAHHDMRFAVNREGLETLKKRRDALAMAKRQLIESRDQAVYTQMQFFQ